VGLDGRRLVRARQVHGVVALQPDADPDVVRAEPPFRDGDAIVTGDRTHAISVRVADCAPVLLADPQAGIVAAVHAGWRGTVAGIVGRTVDVMVARGADPGRIVAAIGPCIGAQALQVGEEVRVAFELAGLGDSVTGDPVPGKSRIDLRKALAAQLASRGVPASRVDVDGTCTVAAPLTQFSYRREGPRSGRMAALIGQ